MSALLRKIGLLLFISLIGIWFQGSLFRSLVGDTGVVPNFPLAIVVFLSFYEVSTFGVFLAFLIGLEFDIFSGIRIGPWSGTFVMIYGVIACFAQRIFVDSGVSAMIAVFLSSVLGSIIYLMFTYELRSAAGGLPLGSLTWQWFLESLFTALLAPLVFKLLKRLMYRKEQMSGRMAGQLG